MSLDSVSLIPLDNFGFSLRSGSSKFIIHIHSLADKVFNECGITDFSIFITLFYVLPVIMLSNFIYPLCQNDCEC